MQPHREPFHVPDRSELEGKALAPMFTVLAVKSYKPEEDTAGFEALLPFKRKQIITVLDWDEKRDAIYGEFDGKRGWFPSSYTKILTSMTQSQTPNKPEEEISAAAAVRNSVPIETRYRAVSGSKTPTSANTLSPHGQGPVGAAGAYLMISPRVIGSFLGPILPSKKSTDDIRKLGATGTVVSPATGVQLRAIRTVSDTGRSEEHV